MWNVPPLKPQTSAHSSATHRSISSFGHAGDLQFSARFDTHKSPHARLDQSPLHCPDCRRRATSHVELPHHVLHVFLHGFDADAH